MAEAGEERAYYSQEDILEAYRNFTDEEMVMLERYAQKRAIAKDGKYSADQLMIDAFTSFLSGTRKWYTDNPPFFVVFWGAIRSISSNWARHLKTKKGDAEFKFIQAIPGENNDLDKYVDQAGLDYEYEVDKQLRLEIVKDHFKDDPQVLELMELILGNYSGPEIKEYMEVDQKTLETLKRKLDRGIDKLQGKLGNE